MGAAREEVREKSSGTGQRNAGRCRHCGGAPHGALQSQPQAGILFPMPGDGQTPGEGQGGEHQWSHLCCGPGALVRHSSVLCRASVLPSVRTLVVSCKPQEDVLPSHSYFFLSVGSLWSLQSPPMALVALDQSFWALTGQAPECHLLSVPSNVTG